MSGQRGSVGERFGQEDALGFGCAFSVNRTATTEIYTVRNTLSLHDALPISCWVLRTMLPALFVPERTVVVFVAPEDRKSTRLTPVTSYHLVCRLLLEKKKQAGASCCLPGPGHNDGGNSCEVSAAALSSGHIPRSSYMGPRSQRNVLSTTLST